jgi:hypothetical protein
MAKVQEKHTESYGVVGFMQFLSEDGSLFVLV